MFYIDIRKTFIYNNDKYSSKGKILYRVGTGAYNFNPYLFGKGDWQDVSRLRLEVNYDDIKGKTFKTVCEYNDKKESGESETDQPLPRTGTEG